MRALLTWTQLALTCLLILIFAGAIVRATGSGLGCPDWPKCWGCLIPPTSLKKVDFTRIDLNRFKAKAQRAGRNPDQITTDTLRKEFNPFHTWVEFINRLLALPMLICSLTAWLSALFTKKAGNLVRWMLGLSLLTVLTNAWLGARVVYSGLKPGTITLHLALAFLLMIFLVIAIARLKQRMNKTRLKANKTAFISILSLIICLTIEGLMGAHLREITDELAKKNYGANRALWTAELQELTIFYAHRTFSWSILALAFIFMWSITKVRTQFSFLEISLILMIFALMIMGIILGHVGIYPSVQVLHVGVAALLYCCSTYWAAAYYLIKDRPNRHSI